MYGRLLFIGCYALFIVLHGSRAHAGTVHMQPTQSLSTALAQMVPGDTLLLHAGVYSQTLDLCEGCYPRLSGTPGAWTTIAAAPGEVVTIRPGARIAGTAAVPYRYISFDRLRLDATGSGYGLSWGKYASHIRWQDGEIFGGSMSGISGMGDYGEVLRMKIHHNGGRNRLSHGFYICPRNARIIGNTIYANGGYGIQVYDPYHPGCSTGTVIAGNHIHDNLGDGAVVLGGGSGLVFCGNVVERNSGGGVVPICYGGPNTGIQVLNNTIRSNGGSPVSICAGVSGTQVRGNLLVGNQGEVSDKGSGTVLVNNGPQSAGARGASCPAGGGFTPSDTPPADLPTPLEPARPAPTNVRLLSVP
jgi:hypothetical protein